MSLQEYSLSRVMVLNKELENCHKSPYPWVLYVSLDQVPSDLDTVFREGTVKFKMEPDYSDGQVYEWEENSPTWRSLLEGINDGMVLTGDTHHVFLERILLTSTDGVHTLKFVLGS